MRSNVAAMKMDWGYTGGYFKVGITTDEILNLLDDSYWIVLSKHTLEGISCRKQLWRRENTADGAEVATLIEQFDELSATISLIHFWCPPFASEIWFNHFTAASNVIRQSNFFFFLIKAFSSNYFFHWCKWASIFMHFLILKSLARTYTV